ncbi:MAG: leucine-rich repeat protein, partial [Muribaculaceae bacterium]|nr:leucine-rich repeat protein [Muribaculaceae bacterium]
ASAIPTVGGSVSGAGNYNYGETCTLTATANTGYNFVRWTKNGTQVSTNPTYSFTVTENASCVAYFRANSYTISVSVNPTEGGTVSGAGTYNHGTTCTLTATANEDYSFTNWTKDGTVVSTDAIYSFTVTGSGTYVANFSQNAFTISASAIPVIGGSVSGAGNYNYGETCTLTATANTGYNFVRWTKNGTQVSTNPSYSFTVTENANCVAYFRVSSYIISASANPTEGGTVSGGGTFNHGTTCTLTATANTNYNFTNWTKDGTVVSTDATYSFTVTSSGTYVANFSHNTYTISVSANPSNGGIVNGGGTYNHGANCTLTAIANTGYTFINWTKDGTVVSTSAIYSFTVTGSGTYVANFNHNNYTISASASPTEGGTVNGGGTYHYGANCTLTATANTGYDFINWTKNGTQVSTYPTYSFTVTSSGTYVANFSQNAYTITATANPTEGGTVSGAGTYNYGATATLTANANTGYTFINWTKDGTVVSTDATYSFTVTSSATYVANFEAENIIVFADPNVKAICVANWDTNSSGELSYAEAAAVTSLGGVFSGNTTITSFEELQYFTGLSEISAYAFYYCSNLTGVLNIPNSVISIGDYAFAYCWNLTGRLNIPNSVTSIGAEAFAECYSFNDITLSNSITSIGEYAFDGCSFMELTIPNSMTSIGAYAFAYCTVWWITIPNSVTSIGDGAFAGCIFDGITLPNSVTSIGAAAFAECCFYVIALPNSVISIGDYAFADCTCTLWSMYILPETPPTLGWQVFAGVSKSIPVNVPCASIASYQAAEGWNEFTNYHGIDCPSYVISATANLTEGGSVTGAGTYDMGTICTLTATANTGYNFTNWTKDGTVVSTNATYSFTVTGSATYVANFSQNAYTISASANPSNGGTVSGGGTYNHGSTCTLTATANTGYNFMNWTKDGTVVSTNATYSFTVTGNGTYVANFGQNTYTILASANPSNGGSVSGGGTYNYGATCTLTATANTGYTFTNWTEDGTVVSTSAIYSFTVTSSGTYVANFGQNTYTISASANPSNGGTVNGGGTYNYGDNCTLTATANTGYNFMNWTQDGTVVSSEQTYSFTVTEDASYVANFELNSYTITATANPVEGGIVTGAGTYNHGATCILTATANTGYAFINWTNHGIVVSTNPTYSFTVNRNASHVANFVLNSYTIAATANPTEGGTVSGAGTYNHGTTCTLTATANEDYTFVNWTENGTEVSTNAIYSFTVTGNRNLVANFTSDSGGYYWTVNVNQYPNTMTAIGVI